MEAISPIFFGCPPSPFYRQPCTRVSHLMTKPPEPGSLGKELAVVTCRLSSCQYQLAANINSLQWFINCLPVTINLLPISIHCSGLQTVFLSILTRCSALWTVFLSISTRCQYQLAVVVYRLSSCQIQIAVNITRCTGLQTALSQYPVNCCQAGSSPHHADQ